ncbi:las seventeen-binding protein [Ophiostoma piceae UAMH 11346]|uniref:Las seventeen-binding protein n=1 Tax=Ophiostoma piceae (strain UAMH 11346) TaxID=1262450 RepID=S3D4N0_OPHP1|nr:las seventeen-binding protein [Ophiostoma piceae UAMH 11346]
MSSEKTSGAAEPAPESFYTQAPAYNPGAPEYANHQGYTSSQAPPVQSAAGAAPEYASASSSVPPAAGSAQAQTHAATPSSSTGHASTTATATAPHRRFGFADKLSALGARAASPINQLANKMGSEGFLPDTMDKECEKAARVLQGFCKHGIYADTEQPTTPPGTAGAESAAPATKKKSRTLITIPAKVIQKAVGLAIFTTGRVGFHLSGATGSGVLIARLPDGSWSPPSGIQIHSVGAGFVFGADIYDCVLVLNSPEALEAFRSTRLSLGSDLAVVAGPYGAGGSVDFGAAAERKKGKQPQTETPAPAASAAPAPPVDNTQPSSYEVPPTKSPKSSALRTTMNKASYSYIKSRGIYAGVKVDGTVVNERQSANTAFYGSSVPVASILRGEVPHTGNGAWKASAQTLLDTIRAAEALGVPAAGTAFAPATAAATPQYQYQQPEAWANAAPATVFHPDNSAYPQAPPAAAGGYHTTEEDVTSTYVKGEPLAARTTAGSAPVPTTTPAYSKAQEAAAESASARAATTEGSGPPPPEYSEGPAFSGESSGHNDLPPAYDHSTDAPSTGDSKTGRH